MPNRLAGLSVALLAAAALPVHAGSVSVTYADPTGPAAFIDAGASAAQRDAHLAALAQHLKALGERRLAPNDELRIELVDLDLAGTLRPTRRGDRRIVKGQADWPRIELRYTLSRDGQEVRSGADTVSDLGYSTRSAAYGTGVSDPLRYEKRALDEWFNAHFGGPAD